VQRLEPATFNSDNPLIRPNSAVTCRTVDTRPFARKRGEANLSRRTDTTCRCGFVIGRGGRKPRGVLHDQVCALRRPHAR
jgi:hypothetical protein